MNSRTDNRLKMMRVVIATAEEQSQIISSIPALNASFVKFKGKVAEMEQVINEQIKETRGITMDKLKLKQALVKITVMVSKALMTYAHNIGNSQIEVEVNFSATQMMNVRDEVLIKIAENIHEKATENLNELSDYAIDPGTLAAMESAIVDYSKKCTTPKEARDMKKLNTQKLEKLADEATLILKKEVDRMVVVLPDEFEDFKMLYASARAVINYSGKKRNTEEGEGFGTIEGMVAAAFDDSPVEDAVIIIEGTEMTAETDEDGEFYFENVPAGTYTLRVIAETYKEATIRGIEVIDEAAITVDAALEADEEAEP